MSPHKKWPEQPPRVVAVRPLEEYRLELTFADGFTGVVDLAGWVVPGDGVFEALGNRAFFEQVSLSSEGGTIEWPNGVDLCPDVLYSRATGIPIPFAQPEIPASSRT
ncbi:MAG: DUF2442 domain-containing protein [Phycisphaerae bacterium]|nr:DUF2442 domain-containing protein [Phycisphaerae bacterium]